MESVSRPGIPPQAHLAFKGVIFEVWQWEQELYDGSTATFEKLWRAPTVEVIATVGDKIIVEEESQPAKGDFVGIVAGRADQSENMLEEAKRELLEETGYTSDDWEPFMSHQKGGKIVHEIHYFIARNCRKVQDQKLDPGEKIEVKLISFEEFLCLADHPRSVEVREFNAFLKELQTDKNKQEEFRKKLFS